MEHKYSYRFRGCKLSKSRLAGANSVNHLPSSFKTSSFDEKYLQRDIFLGVDVKNFDASRGTSLFV